MLLLSDQHAVPAAPPLQGHRSALETAVLYLIPLVERVRLAGSIGSYEEFAELVTYFLAGWKAIREQRPAKVAEELVDDARKPSRRRSVAGVLDLFITLWCTASARIVQFAALRFNLIPCGAATAGVFCAAAEGIFAASQFGWTSETAELSVCLEIVLAIGRDLLALAEASVAAKVSWAEVECPDEQLETLSATADCGATLPSLQLACALVLLRDLLHRMILFVSATSLSSSATTPTEAASGSPYLAPLTRMQQALRTALVHVEATDATYFVDTTVMPSLWGEKWDAGSKYFGARMPSHGLTFAFGQLLVYTREWHVALCASNTDQAPPLRLRLLTLDAHSRDLADGQVGRVLFSCWNLLLERYVQFLSSTTMSAVRREQAVCDTLCLIRWTRLMRHLVGRGEEYRVLVRQALTLAAVVSVVGCSVDVGTQLRRVAFETSAGVCATTGQDPLLPLNNVDAAFFVDLIWGVAPLKGRAALATLSLRELCLPHLPLFARPIAHDAIAKVVPPNPFSALSWLSPEDSLAVHSDCSALEVRSQPLWTWLARELLQELLNTHHPA